MKDIGAELDTSKTTTPSGQETVLSPAEIRILTERYRQKFAPHVSIDNPALARAAIIYSQTHPEEIPQ